MAVSAVFESNKKVNLYLLVIHRLSFFWRLKGGVVDIFQLGS